MASPAVRINKVAEKYNVAVIGTDTSAGRIFLDILGKSSFPIENLFPVVSATEDEYDAVRFREKTRMVEEIADFDFSQVKFAFFMTDQTVVRQFAPKAMKQGALVIDNSGLYDDDNDYPLIVPEINGSELDLEDKLWASPNSVAIEVSLVLSELMKEFGAVRADAVSLEAVSSDGQVGLNELVRQSASLLNGVPSESRHFRGQVAFNVISEIGDRAYGGRTEHERLVIRQTEALLPDLEDKFSIYSLRVPVFYGHSVVLTYTPEKKTSVSEIEKVLSGSQVLKYEQEELVTPASHGVSREMPFVSRVVSNGDSYTMFIVMDNTMKGEALNCLQIGEALTKLLS